MPGGRSGCCGVAFGRSGPGGMEGISAIVDTFPTAYPDLTLLVTPRIVHDQTSQASSRVNMWAELTRSAGRAMSSTWDVRYRCQTCGGGCSVGHAPRLSCARPSATGSCNPPAGAQVALYRSSRYRRSVTSAMGELSLRRRALGGRALQPLAIVGVTRAQTGGVVLGAPPSKALGDGVAACDVSRPSTGCRQGTGSPEPLISR